jgi:geranylgeranyl pyrophosphate synthase
MLGSLGVKKVASGPALRTLAMTSIGDDILWEGEPAVSVEQYLEMIERKTARLFQTAAQLGALAAGADPATQETFGRFGSSLGMAFQVADDLLDVWSPESVTGKTAALDVATRKKALPAILALSKEGPDADELRRLYGLDKALSPQHTLSPEETARAVEIMDALAIRQEATEYARKYRESALSQLLSLRERFDIAPLDDFVSVTLPTV